MGLFCFRHLLARVVAVRGESALRVKFVVLGRECYFLGRIEEFKLLALQHPICQSPWASLNPIATTCSPDRLNIAVQSRIMTLLLAHHSTFRQVRRDVGFIRGLRSALSASMTMVYFAILTALFLAVDPRRVQCNCTACVELCCLPSLC